MKLRLLICLVAAFAFVAMAADINGKWKAEYQTPDGQARTTMFTFKAQGENLTGTVEGARGGPAEIQDGKISGDDVSFTVVRKMQDREFKMQYKGKVSGNEIKFKVGMGEREFEMTAKRAES